MPPAFHIFFVFSKEWKPCTNCKTACSECNALADGTFSDVDAKWGKSLSRIAFYLYFGEIKRKKSTNKVFLFCENLILKYILKYSLRQFKVQISTGLDHNK